MRKPLEWRLLLLALVVADVACLTAAFLGAEWFSSQPALGRHLVEDHTAFILLLLPISGVIFLLQGLYEPQNLLGGTREYAAVLRACSYGLVATVLLGFALRQPVSRAWPVLSWGFAAILLDVERFLARRIAYRLRRRGYFVRRTIVVGADADSVALARQLDAGGSGMRIVGFLDVYQPVGAVLSRGLKILGPPTALRQVAARTGAQEAIIVPQALPWETVQALMSEADDHDGLRIHLSPGFYELLMTKVRLLERNRVPLLTVTKAALTPFETVFKRSLDCVLATALLVTFAPAVLFSALWLRMHGSRQVLQRRRVRGRYGKSFTQLAFSTVGPSPSEFIRKLPGLVNVLAGQLSLVGPRPERSDEPSSPVQGLPQVTIRPGLTGPWRQAEDPEEQVILDLYYVRSYSIWLDLQVLFNRLKARLRRTPTRQRPTIDARAVERAAR